MLDEHSRDTEYTLQCSLCTLDTVCVLCANGKVQLEELVFNITFFFPTATFCCRSAIEQEAKHNSVHSD